jgi:hypothetical protein
MTATPIDPRPLEPADTATDNVQWKVYLDVRIDGGRATQSFEESGTTPQLLEAVAQLLRAGHDEFQVHVTGENACWEWNAAKPYYYGVKYPDWDELCVDCKITQGGIVLDECCDTDELMGWIEYCLADSKDFIVDVSPHDPTP